MKWAWVPAINDTWFAAVGFYVICILGGVTLWCGICKRRG